MNVWGARAITAVLVGTVCLLHLSGKISAIPSSMRAFVLISPALGWYWLHYGDRAYVAWTRWTIA